MSEPRRASEHTPAGEPNAYWTGWLIFYVRALAVVSLAKGLYHWAMLCGVGDGVNSTFDLSPAAWRAATIFFAVIDLVAGVALWLGSTWGAMLWLLTAAMQLFADVIVLEFSGFLILLTMIEVVLVAGYVIIRFMVHVETDRRR